MLMLMLYLMMVKVVLEDERSDIFHVLLKHPGAARWGGRRAGRLGWCVGRLQPPLLIYSALPTLPTLPTTEPPLPPYLLSSALPCFPLQQCVCLEAPSVWFAVSRLHTMFLLQTPQLRPGHLTAGGRPANYAESRILLIIWSPSKHPRDRFGPCMVSALLQI